jgi:PPOX class probable F420-dependent enzyme
VDDRVRAFLERHHTTVQTTLKKDGTPHVAMIGIGFVDGKLWGSSTKTRVRHKHLQRDPRSTLMVLNFKDRYSWLALETTVTILDGDDAPELNLKLYRALAGEPDDVNEYLEAMVAEQRVIYEFAIHRAYGQY